MSRLPQPFGPKIEMNLPSGRSTAKSSYTTLPRRKRRAFSQRNRFRQPVEASLSRSEHGSWSRVRSQRLSRRQSSPDPRLRPPSAQRELPCDLLIRVTRNKLRSRGVNRSGYDGITGLICRGSPSNRDVIGLGARLVKSISHGEAPTRFATSARAASTASRARLPNAWFDDGFPNNPPGYGNIASRSRGSIGVVAL